MVTAKTEQPLEPMMFSPMPVMGQQAKTAVPDHRLSLMLTRQVSPWPLVPEVVAAVVVLAVAVVEAAAAAAAVKGVQAAVAAGALILPVEPSPILILTSLKIKWAVAAVVAAPAVPVVLVDPVVQAVAAAVYWKKRELDSLEHQVLHPTGDPAVMEGTVKAVF